MSELTVEDLKQIEAMNPRILGPEDIEYFKQLRSEGRLNPQYIRLFATIETLQGKNDELQAHVGGLVEALEFYSMDNRETHLFSESYKALTGGAARNQYELDEGIKASKALSTLPAEFLQAKNQALKQAQSKALRDKIKKLLEFIPEEVKTPYWDCPSCGWRHEQTISAACVVCKLRTWPLPYVDPIGDILGNVLLED